MKSTFVKLLLVISLSAMITLAVMGGYIVAVQSTSESILAPVQPMPHSLPSQAPKRVQPDPYQAVPYGQPDGVPVPRK